MSEAVKEKWYIPKNWKVDMDVRQKMLDICDVCDDKDYKFLIKNKPTCKHCGCIVEWKVRFVDQECPIGKW